MTIRTKPASKEYRDGWDRVFGPGVVQHIACVKCGRVFQRIVVRPPEPERLCWVCMPEDQP